MSLNDHVADLSLCEKWKEIGGRQDTVFRWQRGSFGDWGIDWNAGPSPANMEWFAAPLASELMEWIKGKFDDLNFYAPDKNLKTSFFWSIWLLEGEIPQKFKDKFLLNALMQMAIKMEEENK